MASAIVGGPIDIHSGGEDLRFPHHENEIAQAEAYYHQSCGCNFQWVNYFLHSGHLDIKGRKMSKSLKNFKTIKEELQDISARQMRLLFVLQNWERRISYSDSAKEELRARESHVVNFLANMHAALRSVSGDASAPLRWGEAEQALQRALDEAHDKVHERLLDSIDTRGAMDAISTLIRSAHSYLDQ
ncbi:class I (C) tRNA synthetase, partial [Helicosporidium sp. ATCC 50920]